MKIYFAPLEGITDVVFRRAHHDCFSGVTKYYIPFISPTKHLSFSSREQASVSPVENAGIPAVPQILTKDGEHFLFMAQMLKDAGFDEINLNLGCPSGTVTAKGKGSGMLRDLDAMRRMLDTVCGHSALPVSVKTRIGYESPEEWQRILELYAQYPVCELIIHPRTRNEMYRGTPHRECFGAALERINAPCVYNGDLFTAADCAALMEEYPGTAALMLGRGLVANPALAREASGGAPLTREELRAFHDRLYRDYTEKWPKTAVLGHMHEITKHFSCCFVDPVKPRKAIRKAKTLEEYEDAVRCMFEEYPMREQPAFDVWSV